MNTEGIVVPSRKHRFMPRAEGATLSTLIQEAWKAYQDSVADEDAQARVAERLAVYFESRIPVAELTVLQKWGCIAKYDTCNVAVYDAAQHERPYAERFGIKLPRTVPVTGSGGMGYPSLCACAPYDREDQVPAELNAYFASQLTVRKAYYAEYKGSSSFPSSYKEREGVWPTWGEIEDASPFLGQYLKHQRTPPDRLPLLEY
jgi:hypothetical protein